MPRLFAMSDFWSGILFIVTGTVALWVGRNYPRGTLSQMGPGFFPYVISVVLIGIGLLIVLQAMRADGPGESTGPWALRALVLVSAGLVLFGLLAPVAGITVAAFVVVLLPGFATADVRPIELLIFAAALVFVAVGVFVYGLGLNLPAFPWS